MMLELTKNICNIYDNVAGLSLSTIYIYKPVYGIRVIMTSLLFLAS